MAKDSKGFKLDVVSYGPGPGLPKWITSLYLARLHTDRLGNCWVMG